MHSLWEETTKRKGFPSLERNIRTEVLIIGTKAAANGFTRDGKLIDNPSTGDLKWRDKK